MEYLEEKIAEAKQQRKDLKAITSFKAYKQFMLKEYDKHIKALEEQQVEDNEDSADCSEHSFDDSEYVKLELALKRNDLPMPDEVSTLEEHFYYVKAVYGIHGEEAGLFDEVMNMALTEIETLKAEAKKKGLTDADAQADIDGRPRPDNPTPNGIQYCVPDELVRIGMKIVGWEEESEEMHLNREALNKELETDIFTKTYESEEISSKPDGLSEKEAFLDTLTVSDDVAEKVFSDIFNLDPDFELTDDKRVYDLSKFDRCNCGDFSPQKETGMCKHCLGCHPEADIMVFHKKGLSFANLKDKK